MSRVMSLATACSLLCVFFLCAGGVQAALNIRRSTWMSDLNTDSANKFFDLRLLDTALPGTHDSAIYKLANEQTILRAPNSVTLKYGITALGPIIQQLNDGVRYLDIRLKYSVKYAHWLMPHTHPGPFAEEIIRDITEFLSTDLRRRNGGGEILVIKFKPLPLTKLKGHQRQRPLDELRTLIRDKLLPFAFEKRSTDVSLADVRLKDIVDSRRRLVIILDDKEIKKDQQYLDLFTGPRFWKRPENSVGDFPGVYDLKSLQSNAVSQLRKINEGHTANKLGIFYWTMTIGVHLTTNVVSKSLFALSFEALAGPITAQEPFLNVEASPLWQFYTGRMQTPVGLGNIIVTDYHRFSPSLLISCHFNIQKLLSRYRAGLGEVGAVNQQGLVLDQLRGPLFEAGAPNPDDFERHGRVGAVMDIPQEARNVDDYNNGITRSLRRANRVWNPPPPPLAVLQPPLTRSGTFKRVEGIFKKGAKYNESPI